MNRSLLALALTIALTSCSQEITHPKSATEASGTPSETSAPSGAENSATAQSAAANDVANDATKPAAKPPATKPGAQSLLSVGIAENELNDARKLYARGEHAEAMASVDRALAARPDHSAAQEFKAKLLQASGDIDGTIQFLEAQRAKYPRRYKLLAKLALAYREKGDTDKAIALLSRERIYGHVYRNEGRLLLAQFYMEQSKTDKALKLLVSIGKLGFKEPGRVTGNSAFRSLRGNEEFESAIRRMEHSAVVHREKAVEAQNAAPRYECIQGFGLADLLTSMRTRFPRKVGLEHDMEFDLFDGTRYLSSDYADKYQVLFVWSHWSQLSTGMIPDLVKLQEAFRDKDVEVILLAADLYGIGKDFNANSKKWLDDHEISLPAGWLDGRESHSKFKNPRIPLVYFIGKGNIRHLESPGPVTYRTLERLTGLMIYLTENPADKETGPPKPEGDAKPEESPK